jgi:hypothetical protein
VSEHSGLPDLDALAGQHLRYRDLVEAGETWARLRPDNRPRDPGSYAAMARLCRDVLDPVIDRFGPIRITYGHAGGSLTRAMPGGIYPSLDQHAGHERRRDGAWICGRLGQAVDFEVAGVPTSEVAAFIAGHLPFDRLYYTTMAAIGLCTSAPAQRNAGKPWSCGPWSGDRSRGA